MARNPPLPRVQFQQRLDDAATVRTTIDVIAEKHESRRTPVGMSLAERGRIAQFLQQAVNIPDRINKFRASPTSEAACADTTEPDAPVL